MNIRDQRDNLVQSLRQGGFSGDRAEAAGKRLENILTRREAGLPVNPQAGILKDRKHRS